MVSCAPVQHDRSATVEYVAGGADLLRSLLGLILRSTLWSIPGTSMPWRLKSNERKRAKADIRGDDDQ